MGRAPRAAEAGLIYHAGNRANGRLTLFESEADYDGFVAVLAEAVERSAVGLFAFCVMPDHFHLVVRPTAEGALSEFLRWLTLTHTQRWHAQHKTAGTGHVYQGRFKSFPVQDDAHFHTVCRHVESNPRRAGLVERAQEWPWSSLSRGLLAADLPFPRLSPWPLPRPRNWSQRVNTPMRATEAETLHRSLRRSRPFGTPDWTTATARRLGLESTLRPIGRPRKPPG